MLEALPAGSALDVLLKVNTGMNRLGLAAARVSRARSRGSSAIRGVRRHHADDAFRERRRRARHRRAARGLRARGGRLRRCRAASPTRRRCCAIPKRTPTGCAPASCSTAARRFAEASARDARAAPGDDARRARSSRCANSRAGDRVGYGGTFTAERAMRIGVVACGYADGYPRHAPTGTPVLVGGRLTRTLGRVSMDMLCVDLTGIAERARRHARRAVGRRQSGGERRAGGRHRRLRAAVRARAARARDRAMNVDVGAVRYTRARRRPDG